MLELLTGSRSACDYYMQPGLWVVMVSGDGLRLGILCMGNCRIFDKIKKRHIQVESIKFPVAFANH
jgi:hypothetical protein